MSFAGIVSTPLPGEDWEEGIGTVAFGFMESRSEEDHWNKNPIVDSRNRRRDRVLRFLAA